MRSGTAHVEVRNLAPDEWATHRQVRLAALRANPEAFGASLQSNEQMGEEDWRRRTDSQSWFAFVDQEPAGMARLWFDPQTKPIPEIIALWVDDRFRGSGVGRELMNAALTCAAQAAGQAQLWVVTSNQPAIRLYESFGFTKTDVTETLPDGRTEIQMFWTSLDRA